MKWIREFFLIFIFLCGTISIKQIKATNHTGTNADSLFLAGQFQRAVLEYERQIFFSEDPQAIILYRIKKAECYKQLMEFDKAIKCLGLINLWNQNEEKVLLIKQEIAFCYLFKGEPEKALMQIEQLKYRLKSDSLRKSVLLPEIFCYNELRKWDNAKKAAIEYINWKLSPGIYRDSIQKELLKRYSPNNLPKRKSEDIAENLSRFVPGLGQMYCGKILEGSFTFLFNLAFLSIGIHQIYYKFYITGYAAGFGVLHKTYLGNLTRAKNLAHIYTQSKHSIFTQEIAEILISLENLHSIKEPLTNQTLTQVKCTSTVH